MRLRKGGVEEEDEARDANMYREWAMAFLARCSLVDRLDICSARGGSDGAVRSL